MKAFTNSSRRSSLNANSSELSESPRFTLPLKGAKRFMFRIRMN